MFEKALARLDFTAFEDIATARIEPFGLHLFEAVFYLIFALIAFFALRSLVRALAMIVLKPRKSDYLDLATAFSYIDSTCATCGWAGRLPSFRRRCPHCGGTVFA